MLTIFFTDLFSGNYSLAGKSYLHIICRYTKLLQALLFYNKYVLNLLFMWISARKTITISDSLQCVVRHSHGCDSREQLTLFFTQLYHSLWARSLRTDGRSAYANENPEVYKRKKRSRPRIRSVSYTHLDVYKRQRLTTS